MSSQMLSPPETSGDIDADASCRQMLQTRTQRFPVRIRALLHRGSTFQSTMIRDLSTGGAGIVGATGVVPGDSVSVELLNGRSIAGTVRWWLAGNCGIAFDQGLALDDPLFSKSRIE